MKLTMKLFLIISLFCSTAFADGDMNEGQKNGGSGGGLACSECVIVDQEGNDNSSIFKVIRDFMSSLLK